MMLLMHDGMLIKNFFLGSCFCTRKQLPTYFLEAVNSCFFDVQHIVISATHLAFLDGLYDGHVATTSTLMKNALALYHSLGSRSPKRANETRKVESNNHRHA